MPELPEVETTRLGILPYIKGKQIRHITVRERRLRWPVPRTLNKTLTGQTINDVLRRGKYLLFKTDIGTLILHLGMSGSLRICTSKEPATKHDHFDICLNNNKCLRLNDPRRFGCVLWTTQATEKHKLLKSLGPEPFDDSFNADYLYQRSRKRKLAIKNFIMDAHVVVGVGNIYASESLFLAGINPKRAAGNISLARYERLVSTIKEVLTAALNAGGSTLKDFTAPNGKPGYFQHHFKVYGKTGLACENCNSAIHQITLGQRSTFYCPSCQR